MNSKNTRKKLPLVAVVSAIAVGSASVALVACGKDVSTGDSIVGHINVPTATIQAELGTYVSPQYDVVNDYGLILAGYTVSLASVTDNGGETLKITNNSVLVETAGLYTFTYTAKSDRVKDATVTIDFADRTAPTINFDSGSLPSFFIKGNTYSIPSYTLSGDYIANKCWTKVFHIADDAEKTETAVNLIDGDKFAVDKSSGKYRILIHVEDAVGNFNEYPYERAVDGPQNFVENKVAYFDEEFGTRQAKVYESDKYTGEFVARGTAGAQVYDNEAGSFKISFDGKSETVDREGLVYIHTPAVIDLSEYEALEMWVYNETDQDNIILGSKWWNDTPCKKGEWTKVTWSTRNWGGENGNKSFDNRKFIGLTDISGQTVRIVFDYGMKIIPNGNVYLSSMRAIPKTRANVTAVDENVILGGSKIYVNDTITLAAVEQSGKSIDCFTVNGKPIIGDSFTVTDTAEYKIGVRYVDGALTKDNMTWGEVTKNLTRDPSMDATVWTQQIGDGDQWVVSYDVYDVKDSSYIGFYVGGTEKLIGFEFNNGFTNGVKFAAYGWPWDKKFPEFNPGGVKDLFMGATEQSPVTITYARDGDKIKLFFTKDGNTIYFTTVNHTQLGVNDKFGLGERRGTGFGEHSYKNVRGIAGAEKVALYMAQYAATLQLTDCTTNVGTTASLGDWVTLTANPAPAGKMFLHFTVDGTPISGNVMTVTKNTHAIAVVYADKSTLTLADGIETADGATGTVDVAKGSSVTLVWKGTAEQGKYCTGFLVDGKPIDGNVFTASGTSYKVEAVFGDRVANKNVALNAINKADYVYTANQNYKPTSVSYDTQVKYNGADGAVSTDGTVKVTLGGSDKNIAFNNATVDNLDDYKELYFYIYTEDAKALGGNVDWSNTSQPRAGARWCGDTALKQYEWTKVTFTRAMGPQNTDEVSVWEAGPKAFVYRIQNVDTAWITPLYGVPYERSTVSFEGTGIATADGKTVYNREDEIKLVFNGTVPQ
ncbi:MAG: hypothetical protein K2L54_00860, partial [Clostridiales bacterium]|nr:hypothetical protein [Clostridiales bacterium]